jgi:hypothetical protein
MFKIVTCSSTEKHEKGNESKTANFLPQDNNDEGRRLMVL